MGNYKKLDSADITYIKEILKTPFIRVFIICTYWQILFGYWLLEQISLIALFICHGLFIQQY